LTALRMAPSSISRSCSAVISFLSSLFRFKQGFGPQQAADVLGPKWRIAAMGHESTSVKATPTANFIVTVRRCRYFLCSAYLLRQQFRAADG
jgi:hypothetical protein